MKYNRVLLKLSGESLAGKMDKGIDFDRVLEICSEIKECADMGVQIGIVVGGGNFWRGRSNKYMDRATSDYIGMLGTTMNALAVGDAFKQLGQDVRVQTGVEMRQIAELYIKNRADRHMNKGRIVVFGCGTGSPFFSTDTASALRAAEINAELVLKATNVDGIYDKYFVNQVSSSVMAERRKMRRNRLSQEGEKSLDYIVSELDNLIGLNTVKMEVKKMIALEKQKEFIDNFETMDLTSNMDNLRLKKIIREIRVVSRDEIYVYFNVGGGDDGIDIPISLTDSVIFNTECKHGTQRYFRAAAVV